MGYSFASPFIRLRFGGGWGAGGKGLGYCTGTRDNGHGLGEGQVLEKEGLVLTPQDPGKEAFGVWGEG